MTRRRQQRTLPSLSIRSSSRPRSWRGSRPNSEILYRWRWRWQADSGHEVVLETTPAPLSTAASFPLGPTRRPPHLERLCFSRFGASAELTLYNAVLMWLLALLWKIEPLRAGEVVERCAGRAMSEQGHAPTPAPAGRYASFEPLRRARRRS